LVAGYLVILEPFSITVNARHHYEPRERTKSHAAGLCAMFTVRPIQIVHSAALYMHTLICTYMKNISLRDEVYEELSRLKREGESFSDVILRLIRGNRERSLEILRRYAGKLKDSDIEEIIMEERRGFWVREFDL